MRLVALRGENLASLAEPFALEFDQPPLRGAGILAIAGPTGAGKSTLLDAICLALYDRVPRLERVEAGASSGAGALGANDPRALLRHGAGAGFAEVDFIGQDGRPYRARWEVRRARNRGDGRLQRQTIGLTDLASGTALGGTRTETLAETERRIGLDFDQFCRAVLLAQGEFDNFLRARATDRAALLERITGTEIYSRLSVAAFERARVEKAEIATLQQQIGLLAPLPDAARAEIQHARDTAQQQRLTSRAHAGQLVASLAWHDRADELDAARATALADEARARAAHETAAPARAALTRAQAALALRTEITASETADTALAHAITARARAEQAAIVAGERLRQAEEDRNASFKDLETIEADYAQAGPSLDAAQALDAGLGAAAADLARREAEHASADAAASLATTAAQAARARLDAVEVRVRDHDDWLGTHAARAKLGAALPGLAAAFDMLAGARSAHQQAVGKARATTRLSAAPAADSATPAFDRAMAERRMDAVRTATTLLAQAQAAATLFLAEAARRDIAVKNLAGYSRQADESAAQAAIAEAALPAAIARAQEAARARELSDAAATKTAAELRLHLVAGAPCPVCGSTTHQPGIVEQLLLDRQTSDRARVAALQEQVAALRASHATATERAQGSMRAAEEQQRQIARADAALADALARWHQVAPLLELVDQPSDVSDRQARLEAELATLAAQIAAHDAALAARRLDETIARIETLIGDIWPAWQAHDDPLATLRALSDEWSTRLADAERDRSDAAKVRLVLATADAAVQAAAATQRQSSAAREAADAAHQALATQRAALLGGQSVSAVRPNFEQARAEARKAAQRTEAARVAAALEQAKAGTELATALRDHDLAQQAQTAAQHHLTTALAIAGLDRAMVRTYLDLATTLPAEQARLNALESAWRDAIAIRGERAAQCAAHQAGAPAEDRASLVQARQDLNDRLLLIEDAIREADATLRNDDMLLARRGQLEAEITARRARADVWLRLDDLIGSADGARFRRYAQSLTLAHLVFLANRHLWDLRPRYELECAADGDMKLLVRDRDMAGEARGLHNLSGGERFLVSLALALALAGMSTGAGLHVESLFIDEGFGALDPQSLGMAIGTLEQLQATGRQVVVISHLPDLTERLPVKVMVTPLGGGRSSVAFVVE